VRVTPPKLFAELSGLSRVTVAEVRPEPWMVKIDPGVKLLSLTKEAALATDVIAA